MELRPIIGGENETALEVYLKTLLEDFSVTIYEFRDPDSRTSQRLGRNLHEQKYLKGRDRQMLPFFKWGKNGPWKLNIDKSCLFLDQRHALSREKGDNL